MQQCCNNNSMPLINAPRFSSLGRLTKTKKAIIDILSSSRCLLKKTELVEKLKSKKINPDRSTIYRELQFLTKTNIITKNSISGIDYYEMPRDHHHHLICIGCDSINRVEANSHLEKQEKQIVKQKKFRIINHSLEFYGYCHKCQA